MSSAASQYTFNGIPDTLATSVTTTIAGATFSDGAVLSGSWTANYDSQGNLLDQVTATFTVTGPAGTTTFTAAGTLPYANTAGATSYEIHFTARSGSGYDGLYVDWQGQHPSNLSVGTASLYTSVKGTDSPLTLRLSGGGHVVQPATCFLSGTRLLTPAGELCIETLRAGDDVLVLRDGALVAETIRWIGSRSVDARSGIVPVRIRVDAFGPGMPHADLLVTPEHCILAEGGLVPARMLVNGGSIIVDDTVTSFTFLHVELDRHGILLAEGLTTESYLDTGNRANFDDAGVVALRPMLETDPASASWQHDACAPLTTDRATVEPIWRRLAERAALLGLAVRGVQASWTDQPRLRVLLDDGRELEPWAEEPDRIVFWVPERSAPVALLSRSAMPSEVIGPFVDDRRRLGVKLRSLCYGEALDAMSVDLSTLPDAGWHAPEQDGRWTDGAGRLDLYAADGATTMLTVRLHGTMRYPAETVPATRAA